MSNPAIDHQAADAAQTITSIWDELLDLHSGEAAPPSSAHLAGKRVLITGAGGSIGSALALAAHASSPAALILFDTSEAGLYQIDRNLRDAGSHQHIPILGNLSDERAIEHLFEHHKPQIIFHAAALKHVPLMERNPFAAISTNALGTRSLTQTAIRHHAERFILVSTDKAVDPRSIMGASKRIAELILLMRPPCPTHLVAVRLCNVIGSQGSLLPLLLDQRARNTPLTITHPEATRYFITLPRAIEFLFAALETNLSPSLLVPDPGPPLRILDLAQHLVRTHACNSDIQFIGLRPGEKLSEQLISPRERILAHIGSLFNLRSVTSLTPTLPLLESTLAELREAVHSHNLAQLIHAVHTLVPEYEPSSILHDALATSHALETAAEVHA